MNLTITHADCVTWLGALPANSADSCVTDPPYGLEFMGAAWDTLRDGGKPRARNEWGDFGSREHARVASELGRVQRNKSLALEAFSLTWARAVYRVLKPGAHIVAFGGTRTHHRLMCAIEDAGFEIRDVLMWVYGQGFPKNAKCQLKPAWEPIILARKPLSEKNVAANVLKWGTGAINVDGCMICGTSAQTSPQRRRAPDDFDGIADDIHVEIERKGRWPANLVLSHNPRCILVGTETDPGFVRNRFVDGPKPFGNGAGHEYTTERVEGGKREVYACVAGCPVRMLDGQSGQGTSLRPNMQIQRGPTRNSSNLAMGKYVAKRFGDSGGASRFFYCAKTSTRERNAGLPEGAHNTHPTVKPLALMRWLVRLVTPPDGTVLEPFAGSGTTACAAVLEGHGCNACDNDEESIETAKHRTAYWAAVHTRGELAPGDKGYEKVKHRPKRKQTKEPPCGQSSLF